MSHLRTVLIATWLIWGALLPIVAGMVVAMKLDSDLGYGALVGGLVALPLGLWGYRLAEREAERTPPAASTIGDSHRVWMVLFGLGAAALGFAGLLRGNTLIAIPGNSGGPGLTWTVTGPGGIVAALGLILFGAGLLVHRGREDTQDRWGCGLLLAGLFAFVVGHAIVGLEFLVARIAG